MDAQDLANSLFGASRLENTTLNTMTTLQGVAVSDSADGKVKVQIAGESIPEEADATEPNTVVELPTTPAVKEGDTVTITAEGGTLKVMTVTGNTGSGDRAKQATDDASKVATNYIDIDENKGITVGNMTDETLGKNTYIDANGFFVRDGETTLAKFTDTSISLGQNQTTEDGSHSSIYFNGGTLQIHDNYSSSDKTSTTSFGKQILDVTQDFNLLSRYQKTGARDFNIATERLYAGDGKCFAILQCSNYAGLAALLKMSLYDDSGNISPSLTFTKQTKTGNETHEVSLEGHTHTLADITDYTPSGSGETILYDNTSGETGVVTLSESAENFTYLEIYFCIDGTTICKSVKVYNANNNVTQLTASRAVGSNYFTYTENIGVSGTTLSRSYTYITSGAYASGGAVTVSTSTTKYFAIQRVVGIK